MAKRFSADFYDIHGVHLTVDIYDADFVGTATEFDVKFCSINYDSSDNDDISSPIIGSRATVGMVIPITDATLTAFVEDFSTGTEDRFFLEIGKTSGPTVVWRGILTPDFTGEDDTGPSFTFRISAVCGLALLKKKPYHDGAAIYTGIDRFTEHITTALGKLPHTSTFWTGSDIFLKTAVDWWAVSMSSGAADDALFQGGVDHSAFYDYKTQGSVDKDVLSCYDVLWHILKTFECRIIQVDGSWWVEQISYRTSSSYISRHYDTAGAYLSNATNSGVNLIDQTSSGAKLATVQYDFLPAFKRAEVNYDVKIRRNFLNGANLFAGSEVINFDQNISANGGDAICRLKGSISFSVKNLSYSGGANDVLFLVPNFTLMIGDNYLKRDYAITNFTAQVSPPEWTANNLDRIYIPHNLGPVTPVGDQVYGTIVFEVLSPPLPDDGDNNQLVIEVHSMRTWTGGGVDDAQFQILWSASNMFLEMFDDGTPVISEDQILYQSVNPDEYSEVYETTVRLGTAILSNSAGRIMRWNGTIWVLTTDWGQGVDTRDDAIGDLLARNLVNARHTPRRRLNGSLLGDFNIKRLLSTSDGKKWMMANAAWDLHQDTLQGTWFELEYGGTGVNSTPIKKKVIPNGPTYPPIPDPTNPNGLMSGSTGFNINPAPAVLSPVAYNQLDTEISVGDTVTTITVKTASDGNEFAIGDGVTISNPFTGDFQTFTIASPPALGSFTLSVDSATALYNFCEDSNLIVKQKPYAFSLPNGNQGEILRYNGTTDQWEAYAGATDGHVLTWDSTNGWQAEANPAGGVSDGDKGDITVSGGGTIWNIDADAVGTTEIANDAVTFAKIQNIASGTILARETAGSGDVEQLSPDATLIFNGTGNIGRAALTGDVTAAAGSNALAIANNAVTDAKLRDSAALSVIGRSANSAGDPADIAAANDGEVLRRSGTALGFGTVATAGIANDAVTYAKIQNVSTNNRILGRITAGAGDVEELTAANLQTILGFIDGSLTNPRIPYASDANTLTDSGNLRWLNGTLEIMVGDDASLDARYSHNQVANIAGDSTFSHGENNVSGTYAMKLVNTRNTGNTGVSKLLLQVGGASAADAFIELIVNGASNNWTAGVDNSDSDKFKITPKSTAPGSVANSGLIITSAAAALIGINKDAPNHPLDISGRARATQFTGHANDWAVGNFVAGTALNGGGSVSAPSGTGNDFIVTFTTGTTPAANGNVFVATYPLAFNFDSYVTFSPANKAFADEVGKFFVSVRSATSFTFATSGTLTASTVYRVTFHIGGSDNT